MPDFPSADISRRHEMRPARWSPLSSCLLPEAVEVLRHRSRQRQVAGVEPLNLLDAGPGVLRWVEDVRLSRVQDDPHADADVSQRVDRVVRPGERVLLDACRRQDVAELTGDDAGAAVALFG